MVWRRNIRGKATLSGCISSRRDMPRYWFEHHITELSRMNMHVICEYDNCRQLASPPSLRIFIWDISVISGSVCLHQRHCAWAATYPQHRADVWVGKSLLPPSHFIRTRLNHPTTSELRTKTVKFHSQNKKGKILQWKQSMGATFTSTEAERKPVLDHKKYLINK